MKSKTLRDGTPHLGEYEEGEEPVFMGLDFGYPESKCIIPYDGECSAGLTFDNGVHIYDIDAKKYDNALIEKAIRRYIKFHSCWLYRLWCKFIRLINK